MDKTNTILQILQRLIDQDEINDVLDEVRYQDTARKFTVSELLKFWITASCEGWKSFRDGEEQLKNHSDMVNADHSTIAKKASHIPYEFFKILFHRLVHRCNRLTRRKTKIPSFAIDSTTITAGSSRLSWAPFRGEKSGIKMHVKLDIHEQVPVHVEDSHALEADRHQLQKLTKGTSSIYIADRGYASYKDLDALHEKQQFFVIRLKNNAILQEQNGILLENEDPVFEDIYAYLGSSKAKRTKNRFRIVRFKDSKGNELQVATNLIVPEARIIADLYKQRWEVENFFRWIKQNLHVTSLFGTNKDAVFGQIYSAFIAYFITQWLYIHSQPIRSSQKMNRSTFFRRFFLGHLPKEWLVSIYSLLEHLHQLGVLPY